MKFKKSNFGRLKAILFGLGLIFGVVFSGNILYAQEYPEYDGVTYTPGDITYIHPNGTVYSGMGTITITDGVDSVTILDRNLGATQAGTGCTTSNSGACGYYYQWGNIRGFEKLGNLSKDEKIVIGKNYLSGYSWDKPYYYDTFLYGVYSNNAGRDSSITSWGAPENIWGGAGSYNSESGIIDLPANTDYMRQAACPAGYHIPTAWEWDHLLQVFWNVYSGGSELSVNTSSDSAIGTHTFTDTSKANLFRNIFLLTYQGWRLWDGTDRDKRQYVGIYGIFWSVSRRVQGNAIDFQIGTNGTVEAGDTSPEPQGYQIRCFKDRENTLVLTFDSMGGSPVQSQSVHYGLTAHNPGYNPTKEGNIFLGWYKEGMSEEFKFGEDGDVLTEDTTIYAKWLSYDDIRARSKSVTYVFGENLPIKYGNYINTDLKLFSQNNHIKDFDISLTVTSIDTGNADVMGTIMTDMDESSEPYPGFVFRIPTASASTNSLEMTMNKAKKSESVTTGLSYNGNMNIIRERQILSFNYNDNKTGGLNVEGIKTFDSPLMIGAYMDGSGNAGRFVSGNLSDVEVKIWYDTEENDFVLPNPTGDGYIFQGWYLDPDFNQKYVLDDLTENITLYAKWINDYTIKFVDWDDREILSVARNDLTSGLEATLSGLWDDRIGYTFTGWYISGTDTLRDFSAGSGAVCGDLLNAEDGIIYVKATYDAIKYNVTFYDENGTTILRTGLVNHGDNAVYGGTTPTKPSTARYNYEFNGWDPDIDTTPVTSDMEYTATYRQEIRFYTITWKNDNGSTIDTTTVEYGNKPTHSNPTKGNTAEYTYTFSGWTDGVNSYSADNLPNVSGPKTYTAEYTATKNNYTATFEKNEDSWGSLNGNSITAPYGTDIEIIGNIVKIGENTITATPTTSTNQYIYGFSGWNKTCGDTLVGNCTITAEFTRSLKSYIITRDIDGSISTGAYEYGSTPSHSIPTKSGFIFGGWNPTIQTVTQDATYVATWSATGTTYKVNHFKEKLDGTYPIVADDTDIENGITNNTTNATAKTYVGFSLSGNITTYQKNINADGSTQVNLYYKRDFHSITFNTNGGTNIPTISGKYESPITIIDNPSKTGYSFAGWDTPVPEKIPEEDKIITANRNIINYTITYKDGDEILSGLTPTSYNIESGVTLPVPTKTGYKFNGWSDGGTIITKINTGTYGNKVLIAQWEGDEVTYTVNYFKQELDGENYPSVPNESETRTGITNTMTNVTGKVIEGFSLSGNIADYQKLIKADSSTTINLYYQREERTITFINYDGSIYSTGKVMYGQTGVEIEGPYRPDEGKTIFSFKGWSMTSGDYTEYDFNNMPVLENITLYAQYTEHKTGGGNSGSIPKEEPTPNPTPNPTTTPDNKSNCEILTGYSQEMIKGYNYACNMGMVESTGLELPLLRKDLAKMVSIFGMQELGMEFTNDDVCEFNDTDDIGEDMKYYTKVSCKLGLMGLHSDGIMVKKNFDPNDPVTRGELGTVLSRMIWGTSYATDDQSKFYKRHLKALKAYGIMNEIDGDRPKKIEKRGYAMIMMMRASEENNDEGLSRDLGCIGDERECAYDFAYQNDITTVNSIIKVKLRKNVTRIEMAKMLSTYAINLMGKEPDTTKTVKFRDVSSALDKQYGYGVTLAYQLGIMGVGLEGKDFKPYGIVTRKEFATALSRLLFNTPEATGGEKYYEPHVKKLVNENIMKNSSPNLIELRQNIMIMLMRSSENSN